MYVQHCVVLVVRLDYSLCEGDLSTGMILKCGNYIPGKVLLGTVTAAAAACACVEASAFAYMYSS